ncbi:MAG: BrnT family toxin, partial [Gemmatimonadaceae bacterium]
MASFDAAHSTRERRWRALGHSFEDRWLFLVFTLRGTRVRVLAARDMNRKERVRYGEVKERF